MRGRGAALLLALAMSLTLAACGGKDSGDAGAARLRDHGTSGTETPARRSRDLLEDGRYYAGGDGVVSDRRNTGTSEWEKLGRDLRESWDKLMDGAEDTARDVGRGVEDTARDMGRGVENAAGAGEHQTGTKTGTM